MQVLGRPLVVNFGSMTWFPFMSKIKQFCEVARDFSNSVDFVIVYTSEAHASDGWFLPSNPQQTRAHQNFEERCEMAKSLKSELDYPCPIVVDDMDNAAADKYGGRPDRLYIIQNKIIEYQGKYLPFNYRVEEVRDWLERNSF